MTALIAELTTFDRMDTLFVSSLNERNTLIAQLIELGWLAIWRENTLGRLIEITAAGRDALIAAKQAEMMAPTPLMVHHHEYLGHTVFVCKFSTYGHIEARLKEIDKRVARDGYRFARETHEDVHARCARTVGNQAKYYADWR